MYVIIYYIDVKFIHLCFSMNFNILKYKLIILYYKQIQVHLKIPEYRKKVFVTYFEKFKKFCFNLDDWSLQLMKVKNLGAQNIRIFPKINRKGFAKQKSSSSLNYVHLCTQYLEKYIWKFHFLI